MSRIHINKLQAKYLLIGLIIGQLSCGANTLKHSERYFSNQESADDWDDSTPSSPAPMEFPPVIITPGESTHEGSPDGNCSGGGCEDGSRDGTHGGSAPSSDSGASGDTTSQTEESSIERPDDFVDSDREGESGDSSSGRRGSTDSSSLGSDSSRAPAPAPTPVVDEVQLQNNLLQREYRAFHKTFDPLIADFGKTRREFPLSEKSRLISPDYPFKTAPRTIQGQHLAAAWNYKKEVSASIKDSDPKVTEKRMLLEVSSSSLVEADNMYLQSNIVGGDIALTFGIMALDTIISMSPVGWTKDLYESMTGKNILTGEGLSTFEQSVAIVSLGITIGTMVVAPQTVGVLAAINIIPKIGSKIRAIFRGKNGIKGADELIEAGIEGERFVFSAKKYGFGKSGDEVAGFLKNLGPSTESGFSNVLYPRGPGASSGPDPAGYTKVSRWIGDGEVKPWYEGGGTRIPPEIDNANRMHVTKYGAPYPGSGAGGNRVDFHVPDAMLNKGGNADWYIIVQPNASTPIHNVKIFLKG